MRAFLLLSLLALAEASGLHEAQVNGPNKRLDHGASGKSAKSGKVAAVDMPKKEKEEDKLAGSLDDDKKHKHKKDKDTIVSVDPPPAASEASTAGDESDIDDPTSSPTYWPTYNPTEWTTYSPTIEELSIQTTAVTESVPATTETVTTSVTETTSLPETTAVATTEAPETTEVTTSAPPDTSGAAMTKAATTPAPETTEVVTTTDPVTTEATTTEVTTSAAPDTTEATTTEAATTPAPETTEAVTTTDPATTGAPETTEVTTSAAPDTIPATTTAATTPAPETTEAVTTTDPATTVVTTTEAPETTEVATTESPIPDTIPATTEVPTTEATTTSSTTLIPLCPASCDSKFCECISNDDGSDCIPLLAEDCDDESQSLCLTDLFGDRKSAFCNSASCLGTGKTELECRCDFATELCTADSTDEFHCNQAKCCADAGDTEVCFSEDEQSVSALDTLKECMFSYMNFVSLKANNSIFFYHSPLRRLAALLQKVHC